ncbi:hypothetical protein BJY04DRAFT_221328 [Aspergillus karnatakaensis]|uniref:uncharacterized protein n=1 Tax=Aspergillus karnatakaensis TaxID=1810916 RepID=UPI003CCDEA9D
METISRGLRQLAEYMESIEQRIRNLEGRLKVTRKGKSDPTTKKRTRDKFTYDNKGPAILKLNCVGWADFQSAALQEQVYVIDVLIEEPVIIRKASQRRQSIVVSAPDPATLSPADPGEVISILPVDSVNTKEPVLHPFKMKKPVPERIRINSNSILRILDRLKNSPVLASREGTQSVIMFRPFRTLVHFEQDIRAWHDDLKVRWDDNATRAAHAESPKNDQEDIDVDSSHLAFQELGFLVEFFDTFISPQLQYVRSNNCQRIVFHDLWYLFNPGDIVVTSASAHQAFQVHNVAGPIHRPTIVDDKSSIANEQLPVSSLRVSIVHIGYDGLMLGPVRHSFRIYAYQGEREISSLPIHPIRCARGGIIGSTLIEKKRLFLKLCAVRNMHCTGTAVQTLNEIDSQVVVDIAEGIVQNKDWTPEIQPLVGSRGDTMYDHVLDTDDQQYASCVPECCENEATHPDYYIDGWRCDYFVLQGNSDRRHSLPSLAVSERELSDITDDNFPSDEELMTMSSQVFAFVLRSRRWEILDIATLREVTHPEEDPFDLLVLPDGHKDMVQSLIKQHFHEKDVTSDAVSQMDLIQGKATGKGLIILLHGVPGVGKTSTAECVAESFRKPLFPITCGDLGTTAAEVERSLETNFNLANRWGCILLLDEADVFLQSRSKQDFQRNSLVSVFLRVLEYYAGILFLTTNRVGTFDEAFISRIHVMLYYPPLQEEPTVQIWKMHIKRAQKRQIVIPSEKEGESATKRALFDVRKRDIVSFARNHFRENEKAPWNGRQIRNAFQTAIAIAQHGARGPGSSDATLNAPVILDHKPFQIVANASKAFKSYLSEVYHGADDAKRAHNSQLRSDDWGTPETPNLMNTRHAQQPRYQDLRLPHYSGSSYSGSQARRHRKEDRHRDSRPDSPSPLSKKSKDAERNRKDDTSSDEDSDGR